MKLNDITIGQFIDKRKCAKQTTIAIIVKDGKAWVGSNWCYSPQTTCPRGTLPTGVGYEMCQNICEQYAHAELDACNKALENANGATLYLIGHTYCCNSCLKVMKYYGVQNVAIGEYPSEDVEVL